MQVGKVNIPSRASSRLVQGHAARTNKSQRIYETVTAVTIKINHGGGTQACALPVTVREFLQTRLGVVEE